ncbi:MAG: hypothetical protein GY874_06750 [Desulfobacteraceae bacterium]|nr:hypothetical protein [Desulfobacteraceae bacterium]
MAGESNRKLKLNQDQYERLKRCSDKKNMTEWNKWRKKNETVEIWLEGANLLGTDCKPDFKKSCIVRPYFQSFPLY